jgi:hypothetical protein
MFPEDDLRIEACKNVLNVLMWILDFIIVLKSAFVGVYN